MYNLQTDRKLMLIVSSLLVISYLVCITHYVQTNIKRIVLESTRSLNMRENIVAADNVISCLD